jgi:hypothetical protein
MKKEHEELVMAILYVVSVAAFTILLTKTAHGALN